MSGHFTAIADDLGAAAQPSSTTSTTEVPRVVGQPLDDWVVYAAGLALLLAIVAGGLLIRRKMDRRR